MKFLTKRHLSRRAVLRGSGTAIALPLLESMLPAGRLRAAPAPRPRLACIYIPHGAVMSRWTPGEDGRAFALSPTLSSLEPFRDRLNVVSDTRLPNAYGDDASAGANHQRSSAVWITGVKPGPGAVPKMGISADQIAAAGIGQDTPLPSLEVSLEERSTIAWSAPTLPLPMENNPQTVFTRLFGDGGTPGERAARRSRSQSLLDSVTEEIAALRTDLPHADRVRLEQYLSNVREVERRIALAARTVVDEERVPARPAGIPDDYETHVTLMLDLIVLAWQAEITRVSTMMVAAEISNAVYPGSGVNEPFHNLSHHSEIPAKLDRLAQLNEYHVRTVMGHLLEQLAATSDGEGSLLDHALILYGSGMSNSNQHDHDPLPILLAGGASGRLEGGRHIRAGEGTPLSNVLVAMLEKIGLEGVERFGDSTGVVSL
ncbi:MAG: DUF1552 domain-containing protein [Gammaproteobacteria bacterium]|jgi:hypothetical protein